VRSFIRLKQVYAGQQEIEKWAITEYSHPRLFDEHLLSLECELGWNGGTHAYHNSPCVEGSFYPFVRYRGISGSSILDTGCIWIGNRYCFPRIYVDNTLAWWDEPYDKKGEIARDPFLPYFALAEKLQSFLSKNSRKLYSLNKLLDDIDCHVL
jgi:hypothetical protein